MKSKHKTILVLSVLLSPILLYFGCRELTMYSFLEPHVHRIYPDAATHCYAVIFNQGAMMSHAEYFGVIDESKAEPSLIILGALGFNDGPLSFQRIVISSDRTVVAAESFFSEPQSYWLAYDFANSIPYGAGWNPRDEDPDRVEARGRAIQELIQSRGGVGEELRELACIYTEKNKLSWLSWKRWQRRVDQARDKCQQWTAPTPPRKATDPAH